MILPSKHLSEDRALLTIGANALKLLTEPKTVSRLWTEMKKRDADAAITYDWFVLGLDLLYALGLVEFTRGRVSRAQAAPLADLPEGGRHA